MCFPHEQHISTQPEMKLPIEHLFPVCVALAIHACRICLLCDGMLYNQMEGDEWGVLNGGQCFSVSLNRITRTPAMAVQSLSVILINGIFHLLQ